MAIRVEKSAIFPNTYHIYYIPVPDARVPSDFWVNAADVDELITLLKEIQVSD